MKQSLIWISLTLTVFCTGALVDWACSSRYVETDAGVVVWFPKAPAREIVVSIRDSMGNAVGNVEVHPINVSGGTSKFSDANGVAVFSAADFGGEDSLTALAVDGEILLDRRWALDLLAPSVTEGLRVHVILNADAN